MEATANNVNSEDFVHVHVCGSCGRASRREDPDGKPDALGVYRCSSCGHTGPLKVEIMSEAAAALQRYPAS